MGSFRVSNGSTCWQSFLQRLRFVSAFLWRNDIVNSSQQLPFGIRPAQNSGIVQRCTSRTFVGKWLRFARPTMERLAIWPNPSEMRLALPEGVNRMGFCSRTLAPSSRQNNWQNDQPNDKRLQFFSTKERLPIPMPNRIYIVVGTYYMVQVCAGPSSLQCSLDGKPTKLHLHSPSFCRQYLMKPFLLERTQTSFHESQVTRSSNMNIAFGRNKGIQGNLSNYLRCQRQ